MPNFNMFSPLKTFAMNKHFLPPASLRSPAFVLKAVFMLLGLFFHAAASIGQIVIITSPITWTTNQSASQILIKPGGSLTITNGAVLTMTSANSYDGIRIYSYPLSNPNGNNPSGGQLIVDNATITGVANPNGTINPWNAICVLGNVEPNDRDYPVLPSGFVTTPISQTDARIAQAIFRNNAVVEGSNFGVVNYDLRSGNNAATAGGIIQATNTTFRNNRAFAARLVDYRNFVIRSAGILYINDRSFFKACTFTTQNPNTASYAFIYLREVNGISVLGNSFTVYTTNGTAARNAPYTGILLTNAGASIGPLCTTIAPRQPGMPCPNAIPSVFTGLQTAIATDAMTQNGSYLLSINGNIFDNSRTGINLASTSRAYITGNTFNLLADNVNRQSQTAIFLGGCTGYQVEANTIIVTPKNGNVNTFGIAVKNSGANNNVIYRNTLIDLSNALQGIDWNSDMTARRTGLRFLCNTMTNRYPNSFDVEVRKSANSSATPAVAADQSNSLSRTAGYDAQNSFSNLNNSSQPRNYVNDGLSIVYVGNIPAGGYTSGTMTLAPGLSYNCRSNIDNPPSAPVINSTDFAAQRSTLEGLLADTTRADRDDLLSQYAQLHYEMLDVYYGVYNDEGVQDLDSAMWVLSTAKYLPNFQIQLASLQTGLGQWDAGLNTLSQIPANFRLTSEESTDLGHFVAIFQTGQLLAQNNRDWMLVPDVSKAQLWNISQYGEGMARFAARHYLSVYEGVSFDPEVVETAEEPQNKTAPADAPGTIQNATAQPIALYPNPTVDGEVKVTGIESSSYYTVKDLSGRVLASGTIDGTTGNISLAHFVSGTYFVQLTDAAHAVTTFKVTRQ